MCIIIVNNTVVVVVVAYFKSLRGDGTIDVAHVVLVRALWLCLPTEQQHATGSSWGVRGVMTGPPSGSWGGGTTCALWNCTAAAATDEAKARARSGNWCMGTNN